MPAVANARVFATRFTPFFPHVLRRVATIVHGAIAQIFLDRVLGSVTTFVALFYSSLYSDQLSPRELTGPGRTLQSPRMTLHPAPMHIRVLLT